jgi:SAM-dependent methyltransferase
MEVARENCTAVEDPQSVRYGKQSGLQSKRGYTNLTAMDLCAGMLEQARTKNADAEFHRMTIGKPLSFPSDSFDGAISVGVLTVGHAPASSLDELVHVTNSGGYVAFSLRPDVYEGSGFKEKQDLLEPRGRWKLIEVTTPVQVLPVGEPNVLHQSWVYQINA